MWTFEQELIFSNEKKINIIESKEIENRLLYELGDLIVATHKWIGFEYFG